MEDTQDQPVEIPISPQEVTLWLQQNDPKSLAKAIAAISESREILQAEIKAASKPKSRQQQRATARKAAKK